ncbi:MAG: hypothetical protein ACOYOV_11350 [Bacteroidales bacterium]
MTIKKLSLNKIQLQSILLDAKDETNIEGRGSGKSNAIGWKILRAYRKMPRGIILIAGQTYVQLFTRTLPATFSFLERNGLYKDVHWVIGKRPPKSWDDPFERPLKYDNFISFNNGFGIMLGSQDREGSCRGPSVQGVIADEALTLDKDQIDNEVVPTNRGNDAFFHHLHFNHFWHFSSSMPTNPENKWLLEHCKYYEQEAGIDIRSIWKRVVKMQLDLIDICDVKDFTSQWNEIVRLRRTISPFVSKEGRLFKFGNALDNLSNVGFSFLRETRNNMTYLNFLVEIMNMVMDKVEDCYYQIQEDKQVYFDSYDYSYLDKLEYDFKIIADKTSLCDMDCNKNKPLELVFDWGGRISCLLVMQPGFKGRDNFINEFFVKPQLGNVMIDDVIDQFCTYYRYNNDRTVYFYRDRYGDIRHANNSRSYNEQAIARLAANNFTVIPIVHAGQEPPQHDKYLLWCNILRENNPKFPLVGFNGNKCKNLLLSMNNTRVIEKDNKFQKDKSSERSQTIPQQEATHFGDAADKIIWTKYCETLKAFAITFIPIRFNR